MKEEIPNGMTQLYEDTFPKWARNIENDVEWQIAHGAYDDIDVRPGERVFVVTVQSGEEYQRFLLIANVKEADRFDRSFLWFFSLRVVLIAGLIVLIIIGIVIGIIKYTKSVKNGESVQYY